MRLWTIHPKYLDPQGLVALWREALLARAVLRGRTRGYRKHPQLDRFRAHDAPRSAINAYLAAIHSEAAARGYAFDKRKIGPMRSVQSIPTTFGQISHEWGHLLKKLSVRNRVLHGQWREVGWPLCHPLFAAAPGLIEPWERTGRVPTIGSNERGPQARNTVSRKRTRAPPKLTIRSPRA
jgi:hypothetical protein